MEEGGVLTIQVNDNRTIKLLEDLQELNLLKILKVTEGGKRLKPSDFAGTLPAEVAEALHRHFDESI